MPMLRLRLVLIVYFGILASPQLIAQADTGYWKQIAELPLFFGSPRICMDGNVAVVGLFNPGGVAFVYVKSPGGELQVSQLTPSDGNESFGYSVSISGDTIVVGGPTPDGNGKAYVFVKPPGGWMDMTETAQLLASNGFYKDGFGASVSVSADLAVVGANASNETTAAYVFAKPPGGWTNMTQTAKLLPSDSNGSDEFGGSSSISHNTVVIGAPISGKSFRGAAYIFVKPKTGWKDMTETAKLTGAGGYFGWSLSIVGNTVAIGCPRVPSSQIPGVVDVFIKPPSGWQDTSTPDAILTASDGQRKDSLGYSVSASGNTIMAGAPSASSNITEDVGAVYTFVKPPSGWVTGTESSKFVASDGTAGGAFGSSVSVKGNTVVVAAKTDIYGFKYVANGGPTAPTAFPER